MNLEQNSLACHMGILPDVTGSGKSKMAVYKLVISIYRLVDEIER